MFRGCKFVLQRVHLRNASDDGLLKLPPLEKQFLISPPASPPVGWEQSHEMAPVVCSFDLMAKLAAFSVEDTYEVSCSFFFFRYQILIVPAAKVYSCSCIPKCFNFRFFFLTPQLCQNRSKLLQKCACISGNEHVLTIIKLRELP